MNPFQRCPLVSAAALASYLVVHVFAGVLHHHGAEDLPAGMPGGEPWRPQLQATTSADNDEEECCLLCSVLHLGQISPAALQVEAITALNGEALFASAIIRPHPLETAIHSRGPPLI